MKLRLFIRRNSYRGAFYLILGLSAMALWFAWPHSKTPPLEPLDVVKSYFRAIHARDFDAAYGHISTLDRRVRDKASYVRGQEGFDGFALQLVRKLTDETEFKIIDQEIQSQRARVTLHYKALAGDELADQLFDWHRDRLNALPPDAQQRLLAAAEKIKGMENRITTKGRETFHLVKEPAGWKIFLDWASLIKVSIGAALPPDSGLEVRVLDHELLASQDEPFQTNFKLRNRGQRPVFARIHHRIEPRQVGERITMIACGFLSPLTLRPGEEREVSSAYILDPTIAKNTGVKIIYEFELDKGPRADIFGVRTAGKGR